MEINKSLEEFKEYRYNKYLDSLMEGQIYTDIEEVFFKKLINIFKFDLFIDIGANNGDYIEIAKSKIKNIIAFEPDIRSYEKLVKKYKKAQIYNTALYSRNFFKKFYFIDDDTTQSSLKFKLGTNYKWLFTRKLDYYLKELEGYKNILIKIDAEGCEPEILRGMKCLLKDRNKNIVVVFEYSHKWLLEKKAKFELFHYLNNLGIELYRLNAFGLERLGSNAVFDLEKLFYNCLVGFRNFSFNGKELIYHECGLNEFIPLFSSVKLNYKE